MDERFPATTESTQSDHEPDTLIRVEVSNNNLMVNGDILTPGDGVEILRRALTEGRDAIIQGLEEYKSHIQASDPELTVSLAPFTAVSLGAQKSKVLSKFGRLMSVNEQVLRDPQALKEEFLPLWEAIEGSGFTPSLRVYPGASQWDINLWAELPQDTPAGKHLTI